MGSARLARLALLALLAARVVGRPCANRCSGHGQCLVMGAAGAETTACECVAGWNTTAGPDCSMRSCPFGVAWWDYATDTDTAHGLAECSNMGTCDVTTGVCACKEGFEGDACDRMACPSNAYGVCNGRGKCLTMREAAERVDGYRLRTATTYDVWDADKIQGCVCDPGFTGYDCSLRECPFGQDTVGAAFVTEKQVIECTCPTTCSGYFYVGFRGEFVKLYHYDDQARIEQRLETLSTIVGVDVVLYGGTTLCDNDGVSTEITFRNTMEDLPTLELGSGFATTLTTDTGSISLSVSEGGTAGLQGGTTQDGTATPSECSGRGVCSTLFGSCTCQATGTPATGGTFTSSDGEGGLGSQPNCGHGSVVPTACVYGDGGSGTPTECSSHGTCDGTTFKCACDTGYWGNDCKQLACPFGPAWFDEATAADTAHAQAECSNMGICDRETGICTCRAGFEGDACEKLACPVDSETSLACAGHGTCYSIQQLATLSEDNGVLRGVTYGAAPTAATWDYGSVYGCYCDQGYFHGPYAWDMGDWTGAYDCSLLTCPHGDNPQTTGQSNEVQRVDCLATGGHFRITFREETTPDIPYNAAPATVKAYLDALNSVREVAVTFAGGSTTEACSAGTTQITLAFKVPGDLPLVSVDTTDLTGATVSIEEITQGTTEFIECSGQGRCDRLTGVCSCFSGYVSSDGSGDGVTVGQRGDCGAMYIFATATSGEEELLI